MITFSGRQAIIFSKEARPSFLRPKNVSLTSGGLAVGVHDTAEPHQPRVEEANLIRLEVLDVIRQYKGARLAVEEDDLLHEAAAAEDELVEVGAPRLLWPAGEVPIEALLGAPGGGPLPHARGCPRRSLGVGPLPGADMHVVELVGRDQVAHRPQRVDLFSQPFVRLRGGPQEEASAGESDYNQ